MKGRRSSDENYDFGYPSEFLGNVLPSEKEVVSHAHFLRRQKNRSWCLEAKHTRQRSLPMQMFIDIFRGPILRRQEM